MKKYFVKTPRILMRLFSSYTWRFYTSKKEIYLTFDDGPTPEITEFILEQLQKHHAKATFFCLGKQVEKHPTLFQKIVAAKHRIGNHTYAHVNGWKSTKKDYLEDVERGERQKKKEERDKRKRQREETKLFRPPYGKIKPCQAKALRKKGYNIVLWDVLSGDFDPEISAEQCLENVLKNTENGSIVVFHDSEKAQEKLYEVLPKVLAYYTQNGFEFKEIPLFN